MTNFFGEASDWVHCSIVLACLVDKLTQNHPSVTIRTSSLLLISFLSSNYNITIFKNCSILSSRILISSFEKDG